MAGFYADVPGHKMALDRDGTAWVKVTSGSVSTNLTSTEISQVCDYAQGGPDPGTNGWVAAIFPEKRNVLGVNYSTDRSSALSGTIAVQTSVDTTNGVDGTWVALTTFTEAEIEVSMAGPTQRQGIKSVSASAVKGIRAVNVGSNGSGGVTFHVFGNVASGQSPDRLAMWHPTLDQELTPAYLDWGDVVRGTTETRTFRVKNLSAAKTANTGRAAIDILTDTSPSVAAMFTVSLDNATWLSQINLGTLTPGQISALCYVKRTTSSTAQLSLWNARLFAEATTWS